LQNALTDLENVLQTGFFKFLVEESGIYTPPRLVLEYNPFAHKAKEFANSGRVQLEKTSVVQEASKERPCSTSHTKTWDSGEISSFVQMLGLLDQEKTHHSEKITRFQRLNEVSAILPEGIPNSIFCTVDAYLFTGKGILLFLCRSLKSYLVCLQH